MFLFESKDCQLKCQHETKTQCGVAVLLVE